MPSAIDAEKSVLSSIMSDCQTYMATATERKLLAGHFYVPAHRLLFEVLQEYDAEGRSVELVSFTQTLLDRKVPNPKGSHLPPLDRSLMEEIGGPSNLASIFSFAATNAHFDYHLEMVLEKFILRSVIKTCTESITRAYEDQEEVAGLLDSVEQDILAIREGSTANEETTLKSAVVEVVESFEKMISGQGQVQGLQTGYDVLDKMNNGLKGGDMFIIAARPAMGKTSFVMNVVEHVCLDQGLPSMVFSCEMPTVQLVQRMLFARSKVSLNKIKNGIKPTKADFVRFSKTAQEISESKLFIDDTAGISINELRAKARRRAKEDGIKLIAIDYLQLMKSLSKQAQNSREREVAEISAGLKALAKELKIPVIVLAQLNRGPEGRTGKSLGVPRMSDLRESGSIEQDADMVGLLYREAYYAEDEEEKEEKAGKANLLIAKNRNGPTGSVPLTFIDEFMRFEARAFEEGDEVE